MRHRVSAQIRTEYGEKATSHESHELMNSRSYEATRARRTEERGTNRPAAIHSDTRLIPRHSVPRATLLRRKISSYAATATTALTHRRPPTTAQQGIRPVEQLVVGASEGGWSRGGGSVAGVAEYEAERAVWG